jgi:hypothetical protein
MNHLSKLKLGQSTASSLEMFGDCQIIRTELPHFFSPGSRATGRYFHRAVNGKVRITLIDSQVNMTDLVSELLV